MAVVLRAIFYDPDLGLDTEQLDVLTALLRRHLFAVERLALPVTG